MLRVLTWEELQSNRALKEDMLHDRWHQFVQRRKWELQTDRNNLEFDDFDNCSALYIIITDYKNRHLASSRIIHMNEPTLVSNTLNSRKFLKDVGFEVSRFCISRRNISSFIPSDILSCILMHSGKLFSMFHEKAKLCALFDAEMENVYSNVGWKPYKTIQVNFNDQNCYVGIWKYEDSTRYFLEKKISQKMGVCFQQEVERMFNQQLLMLTPYVGRTWAAS